MARTRKRSRAKAPKQRPAPAPAKRRSLIDTLVCGPDYLEILVDVDRLTVSLSGSVEERELARFETFDALCAGYPAVWQRVAGEYEDPTDELGDEPRPMDIQAQWLRREQRTTASAALDDGVWAAKLAKARSVLAKFKGQKAARANLREWMRKQIDLSGGALADSLEYVIAITRVKGSPPLGVSKFGGSPHLPAELAWPEHEGVPMYFLAQLSLSEIADADRSGRVPGRGMLYAFITERATARVLHSDATELAVRAPPREPPDYMTHLLREEARLVFAPAFYFDQATGDISAPHAISAALPATLRSRVADILGCSPDPCDAYGGDRIFGGDPVDWQAMHRSYLRHPLFAQLEYSEGHQSIGIDADDLRRGNFDDVDCRYCGT